jgi:transposase
LQVKQVWVGDGVGRRRFVVCRNLAEAEHDRLHRERALARLDDELAAIQHKQGDVRLRAEGELLAHPTLARYLTRRGGRLVVDHAKVRAEAKLDGKWLLSCTDDALPAADLAGLYKQLIEVERSWRDLKHTLDLRPIYHRKEERIRAHVTLCFLALVLVRVAETATGQPWPQVRRELERMHLGEFAGPAGRLTQRTETTPHQRELLRAVEISEPPLVFDLQAARPRRRRVPAPV